MQRALRREAPEACIPAAIYEALVGRATAVMRRPLPPGTTRDAAIDRAARHAQETGRPVWVPAWRTRWLRFEPTGDRVAAYGAPETSGLGLGTVFSLVVLGLPLPPEGPLAPEDIGELPPSPDTPPRPG